MAKKNIGFNIDNLNDTLTDVICDNSLPFVDEEDEDDNNENMTLSEENLARQFNGRRKGSIVDRRNTNLKVYIEPPPSQYDDDKEIMDNEENEKNENPGPLGGMENLHAGTRGLRRNSISLPALNALSMDQLEHLQNIHEKSTRNLPDESESMICSINDDDDKIESEPEDERKPMMVYRNFRSKRRLSIAPLPALRLNDKEIMANEFDSQSVMSNQNSITSINSLASLLKEKMAMFPAMMKKKRKEDKNYKIKTFVCILFFIIVFLVGYAYTMYNQQILAKLYFDRIKFNTFNRDFRVLDAKGQELITGILGTTVHVEKPYQCLAKDILDDGSVCMEWDNQLRLYFSLEPTTSEVRCYKMRWQSLDDQIFPTDCFDITGHWYGGGWSLEDNNFELEPFITGDGHNQQWGTALKRYFINSRGIAIQVDEQTPLYLSMDSNNTNQICFQARHDDFAFVNRLAASKRPELNYKICTADDMRILHNGMTQKSLWDGLKEKDVNIIKSLLDEPVWQISASGVDTLTEAAIYNYTEDVIALGFLGLGHVLINEYWQKNIGDFVLDTKRFQTLENTVDILHRRGFRISLTIQPFISTESVSFSEAVDKHLLIRERHSLRNIPALSSYKTSPSVGVLDITNNATIPWLQGKLDKIVKDYKIDSFYLDFGTGYDMPRYYACAKTLANPDEYKTIFTSVLDGVVGIIAVNSASSVPRPPAFLSMPTVNSSWAGLQSLIPTVLAYGIIGYPFIMPGPVGGDFVVNALNSTILDLDSSKPVLPDQELYIRWMQLATFLPVLRFTHLPSQYKSDFVTDVVKDLTSTRQKTVAPLLKKYLDYAMNEGLPFIRPLWMLDPLDLDCLRMADEFSVGDELIVAPILYKGATSREVYLPQGVWKDGIDGSLRKGSRFIHNYRVPLDKVAFFVKMPDNTRF